MFDTIREDITRKIRDIKLWISVIPDDRRNDDFRATTFGLFFVYTYGVFEETVRSIVLKTISELNTSGATIDQCNFELYSLILSNEYDSLYGVGSENKWQKRWDISNKLKNNPLIEIPSTIFPTDGKNIRVKQLESLRCSFGIVDDVLPRPEIGGYLQELVNNRNDIAHGNKLPKEVGRSYTKDDLSRRCDFISEICTYICDVYERYIMEKKYLR